MRKKNKQVKAYSLGGLFLVLLLLVLLVVGGVLTVPGFEDCSASSSVSRHAASKTTKAHSDVLADLKKDESFDETAYPVIAGDASLKLIQIAESKAGGVLVYVYQPSGTLYASHVRLSTAINDSLKYTDYALTLLNTSGALQKYKVEDLAVRADAVRYYDIIAVFRPFAAGIDKEPGGGNTVSSVAYSVAQLWTACTLEGTVTYKMTETEVIEVTSQMIGFRRYSDGFQWGGIKSCDAHFLAFSCMHNIDRLLSADVRFNTQSYKKMEGQDLKVDSDKTEHFVTVHWYDEGASKKDKWSRMDSVSDFIKDMGVSDEEKTTLSKYDWIINFYETDYERDVGGKDILITLLCPGGWIWSIVNACTTKGTIVSDVALMRLEFETDARIYNLGVVADVQSGSTLPTNPETSLWERIRTFFVSVWNFIVKYWKWFVIAIVVVLAVGLFVRIVKWIKG